MTLAKAKSDRLTLSELCHAAVLGLLVACAVSDRGELPDSEERIWQVVDEEISALQEERGLPGLSVAVLKGPEVVFAKGYGWANRERQTRVTPETMFPIASIEKQFAAAAVVRLAQEGKLRLDDPITKYLPGLDTDGYVITIRDMLHQMSGLQAENTLVARRPRASALTPPGSLSSSSRAAAIWVGEGFTPGEDVALFRGQPLYYPPRERWSYSEPNYGLMCLVIADLSHKSYYEVIGNLATSAGLKTFHPYWTPTPSRDDPNVAHGYQTRGDRIEPFWEDNAGSAWTTAPGLARWAWALDAGGVVSQQSYAEMTTAARLSDGRTWPYGLGLALSTFEGRSKITHTGHISGFTGVLARYPKEDLTIAILSNLGYTLVVPVIEQRIARRLFGAQEPEVLDLEVREQDRTRLLGTYDAGSLWFDIVPDGQGLALTMREPDDVADPQTYFESLLLYQGEGFFVGAEEPDAIHVWVDLSSGPVDEIAISVVGSGWRAQAIRISPGPPTDR